MTVAEAAFSIGITLFGTGLYFMFETKSKTAKKSRGAFLICLGLVAMAGSVIKHYSDKAVSAAQQATPTQQNTVTGSDNNTGNVNQSGDHNNAVIGNNNKVGNTYSYNTKAESLTGKLVPGSDPTPDNICPKGSNDSVLVFLGPEDSHNAVLVDQFPHTVLAVGNPRIKSTPVLRLERSMKGDLIVDLDIRSHDGKIITRLDNDGFVVNGNNVLKMKKDPRGHSLVVIDQYGKEALNIKYINRGAISLRGVLDFPDRTPVDIALPNMTYFCVAHSGIADIAID